jgi:hypothetical protein
MHKENSRKIHRFILSYCSNYLKSSITEGYELPDVFFNVDVSKLPIYRYPDDVTELMVCSDATQVDLESLGWFCPYLTGKLFIPWFEHNNVQLCELNPFDATIEKPNSGLNSAVPYMLPRLMFQRDYIDCLVVLENPYYAALLNSKDVPAVACNSMMPTKAQLSSLAKFNKPVIFLVGNTSSGQHSAELFVKNFSKFNSVYIVFVDDLLTLVDLEDPMAFINQNSLDGVDYLSTRILLKKNGKDEYFRTLEILEVANSLGQKNRSRFIQKSKEQGILPFAHFSESLHLMGDLIQANLTLDEAREIVMQRYGVSIFLKDQHKIKLN